VTGLRQGLAITSVQLRRLGRDRVGLFFTFVLPVLIIVLLGAAIPKADLMIGVLGDKTSSTSIDFVKQLHSTSKVTFRQFSSIDAMRNAVRQDEIDGGLAFTPIAVDSEKRFEFSLIIDPTSSSALSVRSAVQAAAIDVGAVRAASQFVGSLTGSPRQSAVVRNAVERGKTMTPMITVNVRSGQTSGFRSVTPAAYAATGELVLFMFLIALTGSGDMVEERRLGISRRCVAAPTRASVVVLGSAMGRYAIALIQAVAIMVFTAFFFDVSWGNPIGVGALVAAFALVSTAAGLLVGAVARSMEQATSFGPVVGIALGMLGGCMWPLEIVPKTIGRVGRLTPHSWAVRGLVDLMGGTADTARIVRSVLVLLLFAAVLLPLAGWRLRRAIQT
jgi:ABC-2 type transport system permease protein